MKILNMNLELNGEQKKEGKLLAVAYQANLRAKLIVLETI